MTMREFLPWACAHAWADLTADPKNAPKHTRWQSLNAQCEAAGISSAAMDAAREVVGMQAAIEAGDGGAVLDAISICAENWLILPSWLRDEYLRRYGAVARGFARDWNDPRAFGAAYPKGTNIATVRARATDAPAAYRVARELMAADPQRPIDAGLYEAIGQRVGVGKTRAQELVALYLAEHGDYVPPLRWLRDRLAAGQELEAACRAWSNERFADRHERWLHEQGYAPAAAGVWSKTTPGK